MKASEAVVMYHVSTREKYNELMELFSKENISWTSGPASIVDEVNVDFWGVFQDNTCIATNGVSLSYGSVVRYTEQGYDIIEFNSTEDFVSFQKVLQDKIYQVRTREDYDDLIELLRESGYTWSSGRDLKECRLIAWEDYGKYTCINVDPANKRIKFADLDFYLNDLKVPVEVYTAREVTC